MSLVGFIRFVVKFCIDVLAWPLLGLVYPLCVSIWAIETNCVSDTLKLNTYWVVFSLILLLEHSLNLLEWFRYWHYIRLIIICSLLVPYFDGAFYVYKQVICPCLTIDHKVILNWFAKPKEFSADTEKVLTEVERYVRQNGTEALEKIISSKFCDKKNLEVKEIKEVSSSENIMVVDMPNSKVPIVAREELNPMEVIEKNKVTTAMQLSDEEPKLVKTENRTSLSTETKRTLYEVTVGQELPQRPANPKTVQKEWNCDICCMTTQSLVDFISHLQGKKHLAAVELGKMSKSTKNHTVLFTNAPSVITGKSFQGNLTNATPASSAVKSDERKEKPKTSVKLEQKVQGKSQNKEMAIAVKDDLWCRVCKIKCTGKVNMVSHLRGKKHLNKLKSLAA